MAESAKQHPSDTANEPIVPGQEAPDPAAPAVIVAGPQTVAGVTPREPPTAAPGVLSDDERRLLTAVLNHIIPAGGHAPGAGDIGVSAMIERALASSATLRRLFLDGLVAIEVEAAHRNAGGPSRGFVAL